MFGRAGERAVPRSIEQVPHEPLSNCTATAIHWIAYRIRLGAVAAVAVRRRCGQSWFVICTRLLDVQCCFRGQVPDEPFSNRHCTIYGRASWVYLTYRMEGSLHEPCLTAPPPSEQSSDENRNPLDCSPPQPRTSPTDSLAFARSSTVGDKLRRAVRSLRSRRPRASSRAPNPVFHLL